MPRARPPALRLVNVALGAWLFTSAFLWPHTAAAFANTWMVGAMLTVADLSAYRSPSNRVAQMICGTLAVWLVLSTLVIAPRTELINGPGVTPAWRTRRLLGPCRFQ